VQVQLKAHHYDLSPLDKDRLGLAVDHLERLASTWEGRHLHVDVERVGKTHSCHVRMVLSLAKRRLIASDTQPAFAPAAQRCVDVLSRKIELAKQRVHRSHGERVVRRAKAEAALPDMERLKAAHAASDAAAFTDALGEYEEAVESAVSRRIKFHPEADALLGDGLVIHDIVDAVLVDAFHAYGSKPDATSFREWLLGLVDPAIEEAARAVRAIRATTEPGRAGITS
jgi:hypothetical protein